MGGAVKAVKKVVKKVAPIVAPVVGFAIGGPMGAAIGSGLGSLAGGASVKSALFSAGMAGIMSGGIGALAGRQIAAGNPGGFFAKLNQGIVNLTGRTAPGALQVPQAGSKLFQTVGSKIQALSKGIGNLPGAQSISKFVGGVKERFPLFGQQQKITQPTTTMDRPWEEEKQSVFDVFGWKDTRDTTEDLKNANRQAEKDRGSGKWFGGTREWFSNLSDPKKLAVGAGLAGVGYLGYKALTKKEIDETDPVDLAKKMANIGSPTDDLYRTAANPTGMFSGRPGGITRDLFKYDFPTYASRGPNLLPESYFTLAKDGGIMNSYAGGGFPRRTGQINGPGTGTSDDVPAMLSDGEFVMTARAVRNAGGGSRAAGARRMYNLMNNLERGVA